MNRPKILHKNGTIYWVLRTRNPDTQVLKDADSTPSVVIVKNGSITGDSVTVTKRSATTGIYDCSYNPSSEVEGDEYTVEETVVVTGTTTAQATYSASWEFVVIAVERGTDDAALASTALSTANWTTARAGYLDNVNNAALATTVAQTGDAFARLGPPVGASISADIATIDVLVDAIVGISYVYLGTVASGTSTTEFVVTGSFTTNAFIDALVGFASGALAGQYRPIVSMDGGTKTITVSEAFTGTPGGAAPVYMKIAHVHPVSDIQAGLSTLTQTQVTGGAYALNSALFAFNAALDLTTTQKASVTTAVPTVAQIRTEFDANSTKLSAIQDRVSYCLTVLVGACADAGTSAETYTYTIGGETFTADYTGLDATGNRTTTTLSKV